MARPMLLAHDAMDERPARRRDEDWRPWLRAVGRVVRRIRELLEVSQDHLGRESGISQGAISRLEAGHGLATPAVVMARVFVALITGVKRLDPVTLPEEAKELLAAERWLVVEGDDLPPPAPPADGDGLGELVRAYHRLAPGQREAFVTIARAVIASFARGETPLSFATPEGHPKTD